MKRNLNKNGPRPAVGRVGLISEFERNRWDHSGVHNTSTAVSNRGSLLAAMAEFDASISGLDSSTSFSGLSVRPKRMAHHIDYAEGPTRAVLSSPSYPRGRLFQHLLSICCDRLAHPWLESWPAPGGVLVEEIAGISPPLPMPGS